MSAAALADAATAVYNSYGTSGSTWYTVTKI